METGSGEVLTVPTGALFRDGSQWSVFVLDGHHARLRSVEVGHSDGFDTEIRSGLEAGERVIVNPSDDVEDGVRVKPS